MKLVSIKVSVIFLNLILLISMLTTGTAVGAVLAGKTGTMWAPYIEWSVDNPSYSGNPFDLVSTVTFTHTATNTTHTTEMFYTNGTTWKFRFVGTLTGAWTFLSSSSDPDLNGHTGTVNISPNGNKKITGFTTNIGNKWARVVDENQNLKTFVPQFRMAVSEVAADWTPSYIDSKIQSHLINEGFNGMFVFVGGKWVNSNATGSTFSNNDPDPVLFDKLETIITKVHAQGRVVHIWYNGDCSRSQCVQAGFGSNGARSVGEQRLLRYIGARLAPLPGWVMGYGYDITEDANTADLRGWGSYLRSKMGWSHFLAARDGVPIGTTPDFNYTFWPEASWYSKGNFFNGATYNEVVAVFDSDTSVPHTFDERWWTSRLSEDGQRRQLWTNMMAGGVSAIWGSGPGRADPYNNPNWFKTFFSFWEFRTLSEFSRDNSLSNGYVLKTTNNENFVFYAENTSSITYNLSSATSSLPVVAIDSKIPYAEISLGTMNAGSHTWTAPYASDWVIAVGVFADVPVSVIPPVIPPTTPTGVTVNIN